MGVEAVKTIHVLSFQIGPLSRVFRGNGKLYHCFYTNIKPHPLEFKKMRTKLGDLILSGVLTHSPHDTKKLLGRYCPTSILAKIY